MCKWAISVSLLICTNKKAKNLMNNCSKALLFPILFLTACSVKEEQAEQLALPAPIWPDYADATLPINLAPIRFAVADSCGLDKLQAVFEAGTKRIAVKAKNGEIAIDATDWEQLKHAGAEVSVRIQGQKSGKWVEFTPFKLYLSADEVDPYIAYRLIEPGYEVWGEMGIYQRCLENYDEKAILTNRQTEGGCMNCHSFNQRNPKQMLMHLRQACGGTYVAKDGSLEKLNTKTPETISALVYPFWHPEGRYVAFSTNDTKQVFHSTHTNRIEVFDRKSDVVIYDTEQHEIFSCPQLKSNKVFETFPTFSPDGSTLYFCSADSVDMSTSYDSVHYSLCSLAFDAKTRSFGQEVDTLYNARLDGGSISFPRLSPDGRWLMYTLHDFGNFSIWHKEADLWMIDLQSPEKTHRCLDELNSDDVDSYHSWSSNGRWVIFSSRRIDGLYTRLYLSHLEDDGTFSKPVLLPQHDVHYYDRLMKSYNIPEFVQGEVNVNGLEQLAKQSKGVDLRYRTE